MLRAGLRASAAARFLLVCGLAFAALVLLVGPEVLLHPNRAAVGLNPASDFQIMTWSLEWWPWALGHGVDPLHTSLLWAPSGFSTLWMTTIPVPALLATPLTLAAGPLVSYNVLMLLATPLAAGSAYLLSRELTDRFLPSLVGALLFGLSPYMLGHTFSQHLNLVFVFPIPLLALFCVRYLRRKTSGRRFVLVVALLLFVELGSSLELFSDLTLFAVLGLGLVVAAGASKRGRYLRLAGLIGLAYVVLLPVLIPVAILALTGPHAALHFAPTSFSTDLANIVVPTPTLLAGALRGARAISLHFVGNVGEQDGYLGIPLIVLVLAGLVREWRRGAWIAGGLLLFAVLLSFGPTLTVVGRPLLNLPFAIAHLPVFSDALPARLSLFSALCASVLVALWLARTRHRWLRFGVAVFILGSMLPNFWPPSELPGAWAITSRFGYDTPQVSTGFVADPLWRRLIAPGATVLVLPTGDRTTASWWQVESGMRFALAVPATPFSPPALAVDPVVQGLVNNDLRTLGGHRLAAARLRAFLTADHVTAVLVTTRAGDAWEDVVAAATASHPALLGTARLFQVSAGLAPLIASSDLHVLRRGGAVLKVWVAYDGQRAEVRAFYRARHARRGRITTLSSMGADASGLVATMGPRGQAAIAFTEYRSDQVFLRVATATRRWRITPIEQSGQAITSVHLTVLPGGATLASWIGAADPLRILRAAPVTPGGRLGRISTLDEASTLGNGVLQTAGTHAIAVFNDGLANENRVLLATYDGGHWSQPITLATSLWSVSRVSLSTGRSPVVSWQLTVPGIRRSLREQLPVPRDLIRTSP
jgi:hypothetical protein